MDLTSSTSKMPFTVRGVRIQFGTVGRRPVHKGNSIDTDATWLPPETPYWKEWLRIVKISSPARGIAGCEGEPKRVLSNRQGSTRTAQK